MDDVATPRSATKEARSDRYATRLGRTK
jgi:hypothetical protein